MPKPKLILCIILLFLHPKLPWWKICIVYRKENRLYIHHAKFHEDKMSKSKVMAPASSHIHRYHVIFVSFISLVYKSWYLHLEITFLHHFFIWKFKLFLWLLFATLIHKNVRFASKITQSQDVKKALFTHFWPLFFECKMVRF